LTAEARALRVQIEDDRRASEAQWIKIEQAIARSMRAYEQAFERAESHGLHLAVAVLALSALVLPQAVAGKLNVAHDMVRSWGEVAFGAALFLLSARLVQTLRTAREQTRRNIEFALRIKQALSDSDRLPKPHDETDEPLHAA
jgi:hypothetical protein